MIARGILVEAAPPARGGTASCGATASASRHPPNENMTEF